MPLVLNGTTGVQDNSGAFVAGTAVASTSGTSITFTSIPSWVKRVTVMFVGVSTTGTGNTIIQIGTGGTPTTSGYSSIGSFNGAAANGATFYITGVQLERGTQATSFEYRQYGTELALCQRYFYKDFPATVSSAFSAGLCYNSTTVLYAYRYPVTMRSAPTLSYSALSDINIILGNNVLTPTSITADGIGTSSCRLNIGCTGGAAGNGSIFQGVSSNAFLSFSAEL